MYLQSWRRTSPKKRNHHDLGCIYKRWSKASCKKGEDVWPKVVWIIFAKVIRGWKVELSIDEWTEVQSRDWEAKLRRKMPGQFQKPIPSLYWKWLHCNVRQRRTSRCLASQGYDELDELEDVMLKRLTKSWGRNSSPSMRSCLPSDQHRDLACQVLNIVIMPANAVEFIDLPGIAVKATISNIVWVGGEKLSIVWGIF